MVWWTWRALQRGSTWASMVLAVALLGQATLIQVTVHRTWFTWVISIFSLIAAAAMVARIVLKRFSERLTEEAAWLSAGVWIASAVEVALTDGIRPWSQVRLVLFDVAFAMLSIGVYVVERGWRERRAGS